MNHKLFVCFRNHNPSANYLVNHCKVIPAINQVETHVFRQQKKLRELECQIGTKHESWSPLACGQNNIWNNPVLVRIDNRCKAYGYTL